MNTPSKEQLLQQMGAIEFMERGKLSTYYNVTYYISHIDAPHFVGNDGAMTPRYKVTLTEEDRSQLEALTRSGKTAASKFIHARALLLCDSGPLGSPWKVADVAEALGVTSRTIEHLKERFVEEGIEAALERKPRAKPPDISFDGAFDARLTALACSPAPSGRARWTVRLLAEKVVELKIAPKVSTMTVQRALKKMSLSLT